VGGSIPHVIEPVHNIQSVELYADENFLARVVLPSGYTKVNATLTLVLEAVERTLRGMERCNIHICIRGIKMNEETEVKPDETLDCIGLFCPIPVFNTTEAINSINIGEVLEVLTDDPASTQDIPRWAKRTGHKLLKFEDQDDNFRFLIERTK